MSSWTEGQVPASLGAAADFIVKGKAPSCCVRHFQTKGLCLCSLPSSCHYSFRFSCLTPCPGCRVLGRWPLLSVLHDRSPPPPITGHGVRGCQHSGQPCLHGKVHKAQIHALGAPRTQSFSILKNLSMPLFIWPSIHRSGALEYLLLASSFYISSLEMGWVVWSLRI